MSNRRGRRVGVEMHATWALAGLIGWAAASLYACSTTPGGTSDGGADGGGGDAPGDDASVSGDGGLDGSLDPKSCDAPENEPPPWLHCTGLYSNPDTKTVSTQAVAFAPSYVLWSDGADKFRWLSIPEGTQIDSSNPNEWSFPVGTKAWKEFRLQGKRIETRFFWKVREAHSARVDAWTWTTYRWDETETYARRLDTGEQDVAVNGTATTYQIPTRQQCRQCHTGRIDRMLGFEAVSLAGPSHQGPSPSDLFAAGKLSASPPPLLLPDDGTGHSVNAVGWLHANCGTSCHNRSPDALAKGTGLFLRVEAAHLTASGSTPRVEDLDVYKTAFNVAAVSGVEPAVGRKRILPGAANESAVVLTAEERTVGLIMPPILSAVPDPHVQWVRSWVNARPAGDGGTDGGAEGGADGGADGGGG